MRNIRGRFGGLFLFWTGSCVLTACSASADVTSECDALTVRVIQPDRQAAQLIKLFEGSRAAHPAAALAAWKRATRDPLQLGKTLEAVIALANPEMVSEWRIFDQAELRMNLGPNDRTSRWHALVPRDDGTAASMITAFRLSDLEEAPPINEQGKEFVVTRFSQTGTAVVTHVGAKLVLAGSRDDLGRALQRVQHGTPSIESRVTAPAGPQDADLELSRLASTLESGGLVFDLKPSRIVAPRAGSLELRRAVELLHALGCQQMIGTLALAGERLSLDVETRLDVADRPSGDRAAATVEPRWLELIPSRNLIGVISLAVESTPRFWDRLFALADRLERVDPARRDVAPLRTRFNLLAATAGVRPEADLWPRLRGLTACAVGDPQTLGRFRGGILVLHADTAASALRLANEFLPRFSALAMGKPGEGPVPDAAKLPRQPPDAAVPATSSAAPRRLGTVGGRALAVCRHDRDVLVGWGDERVIELLKLPGKPAETAAAVCAGWARENKPAPRRVGALWPTRLGPMLPGVAGYTPAVRVLADDPPLVWWGWSETTQVHDVVFWTGLRRRVQRFLNELPLDTPPYR
ncbi:MAG: hypothetical protein ACLQVF_23470 [Isosphaeraceae bacterium]